MGNLREAERWYLKVLKNEKDHAYTLMKLAGLYGRMNQPAKAAEYLRLATNPVNQVLGDAARGRASVPAPRDARRDAVSERASSPRPRADLKAAIALTPRQPDLHFNLAQVYEAAADIPHAIENYRKEVEIAPRNAGAYMNLGLLLFQAGQVEAASAAFQKLHELTPSDPRAGFLLAETYNVLNRNLDDAIRLTRQGLAVMPEHKRGYVLMAQVYEKLGRKKEAQEALAKAGPVGGGDGPVSPAGTATGSFDAPGARGTTTTSPTTIPSGDFPSWTTGGCSRSSVSKDFNPGLSWLTILRKREAFRRSFADFDFEKVARFGSRHVDRMLADASIVRHRGKIESTIANARRALDLVDEFGSIGAYVWRYEPVRGVRRQEALPAEAAALSKDLKKRGWTFVGPTTVYAFMQAMGMVNDHAPRCVSLPDVGQGPTALPAALKSRIDYEIVAARREIVDVNSGVSLLTGELCAYD